MSISRQEVPSCLFFSFVVVFDLLPSLSRNFHSFSAFGAIYIPFSGLSSYPHSLKVPHGAPTRHSGDYPRRIYWEAFNPARCQVIQLYLTQDLYCCLLARTLKSLSLSIGLRLIRPFLQTIASNCLGHFEVGFRKELSNYFSIWTGSSFPTLSLKAPVSRELGEHLRTTLFRKGRALTPRLHRLYDDTTTYFQRHEFRI